MFDKTMMIVDDICANHEILEGIFENEYNIIHAANGAAALELLEEYSENVSIIILDLVMPVMNGFEFMERIAKLDRYALIPIVVITSFDSTENELKALELGACDLIIAPFEPAIVKARVRNIVSRIEYDRMVVLSDIFDRQKKDVERQLLVQMLSQTVICEYSMTTGKNSYSANISDIFSGTYSAHEILPDIWTENDIISFEDARKLRSFYSSCDGGALIIQLKTKAGSLRWHSIKAIVLENGSGQPDTLLLKIDDINSNILYEQQLSNNRRIMAQLSETLSGGLLIFDNDENFSCYHINDKICEMLGYTVDEFRQISGSSSIGMIYSEGRERVARTIRTALRQHGEYRTEYRLITRGGDVIWVLDTGRKFIDIDGKERVTSIITDISALKKSLEALRYQAEYDHLTDIFNKEAFYTKTRELIETNDEKQYAVICLDIEHFKVINDLFGIATGDRLLRCISGELKAAAEEYGGITGRIGADIFALCVANSSDNITKICEKISCLDGFSIGCDIRLVFGIYVIFEPDTPVNLMCDRALLALNTVKGNYLSNRAYYNEDMRRSLLAEQEIVDDMNTALIHDQFITYFQPQFNHATGKLIGAEVLVRWQHPVKGLIPPNDFIPVFEKNGFIVKLDEYVWESACKRLRRWLDCMDTAVPISVNISRMDIYNPSLCDILTGLIEKYELPIELFKLEITESAYTENPKQLISVVEKLRSIGFTVEMDDFGSGYSSLNTLKDVPVDVLKIDMRFLAGQSERGGNILNSIVRMAKWLDLDIIAEGVETIGQADFLKSIGCTHVQGYLYSKPLPVQDFESLLMSSSCESETSNRSVTYIDTNEFLNPDAMTSLIFNNFVGAAGVFELFSDNIETLRANDSFFDIIGMSREEYESHRLHLLNLIHKDDRERFLQEIQLAMQGCTAECECRLVSMSGEAISWIRLHLQLLASSADRHDFYITFENITLSKDTEKRLDDMARSYRSIIDSLPGGIGLYDVYSDHLSTIYVNSTMADIFGMSKEKYLELLGSDGLKQAHPDDRAALVAGANKAVRSGIEFKSEFRYYAAGGALKQASVRAKRCGEFAGIPRLIVFILDVTDIA